MLYYWLFSSLRHALDVDEADVCLIPAYEMVFPNRNCAKRSDLVDILVVLNPKLTDKHWVKAKGPCYLRVKAHVETWHICRTWTFTHSLQRALPPGVPSIKGCVSYLEPNGTLGGKIPRPSLEVQQCDLDGTL